MDAHVIMINPLNQMVGLKSKTGSYTVIAITRGRLPKVGDRISGAAGRLGTTRLVNLSERCLLTADVMHFEEPVAQRVRKMIQSG